MGFAFYKSNPLIYPINTQIYIITMSYYSSYYCRPYGPSTGITLRALFIHKWTQNTDTDKDHKYLDYRPWISLHIIFSPTISVNTHSLSFIYEIYFLYSLHAQFVMFHKFCFLNWNEITAWRMFWWEKP